MHPVLTVLPGERSSQGAGTFAFKHQQRSGMLLKTTMRLRRLFVSNENATNVQDIASQMRSCQNALSQVAALGTPSALPRFLRHDNASVFLKYAEWVVGYRQPQLRAYRRKREGTEQPTLST